MFQCNVAFFFYFTKNDWRTLERKRGVGGHRERERDRQTDKKIDRQTEGEAERDRHRDAHVPVLWRERLGWGWGWGQREIKEGRVRWGLPLSPPSPFLSLCWLSTGRFV